MLVISGLNAYLSDGKTMPESFKEQAEVIWTHLHLAENVADAQAAGLQAVRVREPADVRTALKRIGHAA